MVFCMFIPEASAPAVKSLTVYGEGTLYRTHIIYHPYQSSVRSLSYITTRGIKYEYLFSIGTSRRTELCGDVMIRNPRGGGTASLKVGTHCQTTALAFWPCPPLSFL